MQKNERRIIGKIQKTFFFRGGHFWKAILKKCKKKFIVPNHPLGHTDHLYTYKLYVEHVGWTEKREKPSKLAILLVKKSNTFIGSLAPHFEA